MAGEVVTPESITDPYAPEPSSSASVVCVLQFADGRVGTVVTDARVVGRHTLIRSGGATFDFRADDERVVGGRKRWVRVYSECRVVEL